MKLPTGVEIHGKTIRISFIFRGKRCREVLRGWEITNSNLKKAHNLRSVILGEIQAGKFDYAERFPNSRNADKFGSTKKLKTFKDLTTLYLSSKEIEVSAATLENIKSKITTLTSVVGENTYIAEIQQVDLLRYRKELLNGDISNPIAPWLNKKGRATSTVNSLMSLLATMLKLAYQSSMISHKPYEFVRSLKRGRKEPDPLMPGEYQAFISALSHHHALFWTLAIHTGMRHGELCSLAWEDIDLDKGEIRVSRNMTNKGLFVPPKTIAGKRVITLLKPAIDALRAQYKITGNQERHTITLHSREYGKTEEHRLRFVFCPQPKTGAPYFAKTSVDYSWKKGLKDAGVRVRNAYQSRHTFACWLLSSGANPAFIASQMGHENSKMVYEVYSKWIGELDGSQVDMLNEKLKDSLSQTRPICFFVQSKAS
ncbi:integrase [Klebsiella aerogenes]